MILMTKICIVVILILSWTCFVEEAAGYFFLHRGDRTRFRILVFFTIGIMDTILLMDYFFTR